MSSTPSATGRDVFTLLVFFLVGVPMAYYIWHSLSDLLRGVVNLVPLLITAVLIVVFLGFARLFGKTIQRMAGREF